jgi:hypothetical protein
MNQGVRGRALMKKTRGKISRVSVPLKAIKKNKYLNMYCLMLLSTKEK